MLMEALDNRGSPSSGFAERWVAPFVGLKSAVALRQQYRNARFKLNAIRHLTGSDLNRWFKKLFRCRIVDKQATVLRKLTSSGGGLVRSGAFSGMKLDSGFVSLSHTSKLLGTYECELSKTIIAMQAGTYETIIDLGCAEGYYAIGMSLRLRPKRTIAVDISPKALMTTMKNAELNGIADSILLSAGSTHALINQNCVGRTLVICDVEGAEKELLNPEICPCLFMTDLIVEIHDGPGESSILDQLARRFTSTHCIEVLESTKRKSEDFSLLAPDLSPMELEVAMNELRPHPMRWLIALVKR